MKILKIEYSSQNLVSVMNRGKDTPPPPSSPKTEKFKTILAEEGASPIS